MGVYKPMYNRVCRQVVDIGKFYRAAPYPVYKLNLYFRSETERTTAREKLQDLPVNMVFSEKTSLEFTASGATKGIGLVRLCEELGIPVSQTIAVGDADNDLDIMATAGLAVAMGNARVHIKAAADVVVSDNDHGGCAEAIDRYLLGNRDDSEK